VAGFLDAEFHVSVWDGVGEGANKKEWSDLYVTHESLFTWVDLKRNDQAMVEQTQRTH
jgi:hypothetical protein